MLGCFGAAGSTHIVADDTGDLKLVIAILAAIFILMTIYSSIKITSYDSQETEYRIKRNNIIYQFRNTHGYNKGPNLNKRCYLNPKFRFFKPSRKIKDDIPYDYFH